MESRLHKVEGGMDTRLKGSDFISRRPRTIKIDFWYGNRLLLLVRLLFRAQRLVLPRSQLRSYFKH